MVKYSVRHFADFYRGIKRLANSLMTWLIFRLHLKYILKEYCQLLKETPFQHLSETKNEPNSPFLKIYILAIHLRGRYKTDTLELIEIFSRLDAWYSMAVAVKTFHLGFPEFVEQSNRLFDAKGLYHMLLPQPVAYDLRNES